MPEVIDLESEDEVYQPVETRQERLDRDGIYGEIKRELIRRGIPPEEIAFIHDFNTPAAKARAFAEANAGKIRVMIASTEKAGAGTNMQQRLVALHHLDAPWRPSDVEQRNGRILRPDNRFAEVRIYIYVTERSFDIYMWQVLESKAKFIAQIMSGNVTARTVEDLDEMVVTAGLVKAIATGNPHILEKVYLETELSRLSRLYLIWCKGRREMEWEQNALPARLHDARLRVISHQKAVETLNQNRQGNGATFAIEIKRSLKGDQWITFNKKSQACEHMEKLRHYVESLATVDPHVIGSYLGFEVCAQRRIFQKNTRSKSVDGFLRLPGGGMPYWFDFSDSVQGTIQSIHDALRYLDTHVADALRAQAELNHKQVQIERALSIGWEYAQTYEEFRAKLLQVDRLIEESGIQIDSGQDFVSLSDEAFRNCKQADRPDHQLSEAAGFSGEMVTGATSHIAPPGITEIAAAMTNLRAPEISATQAAFSTEMPDQSSSLTMGEKGEPEGLRPDAINDLRKSPEPKKKRSSSPDSSDDCYQLTLW